MSEAGVHIVWMAGGRLRRPLMLAVLPALLLSQAAFAAQPDLYSATVIVTGRDNLAERARGIREALPLVLTKLTVDDETAERAVAEGIDGSAETAVERFDYLDRKEGIQISDEQGTRERSFELTVRFDPEKVDAMVEELGGSVWTGERPQITVALVIDDGVSAYLLTRTSEKGWGQRLALEDESKALAVPVALPAEVPAAETLDAALAKVGVGAPARLEGHMAITPSGYWNTAWRFTAIGSDERFATEGVTFDAAIAEALRHSAKTLAKR